MASQNITSQINLPDLNSVEENDDIIEDLVSLVKQSKKFSLIKLSVTEGKYRMVRRILHNAGHSVINLHRIQYGDVHLGDIQVGDVRPCLPHEIKWAQAILKSSC